MSRIPSRRFSGCFRFAMSIAWNAVVVRCYAPATRPYDTDILWVAIDHLRAGQCLIDRLSLLHRRV